MTMLCKTCGNKIADNSTKRCPRCNTIIKKPPKCGDCKGCSLGKKDCTDNA